MRRANGHPAENADGFHRDADESHHVDHRHSRCSRLRNKPTAAWSSTTHSCRLTFSGRSNLGADIVVHSTTKYLNGHSDSVGGVVVLKRQDDADRLQFIQNAAGAILSPFDSWLVLRGIKTLPVRMDAHNANGMAVAQVSFRKATGPEDLLPGLPDHPATSWRKSR